MRWLGLDIGGANLKCADVEGHAEAHSFALWKEPDRLGEAIARLLSTAPAFDRLAVTITGELADCYATREEGIVRILDQLTCVVPAGMVRVFTVDGDWLSVGQAARSSWSVSASNWVALSQYSQVFCDAEAFLMVDVGSTTIDVIPMTQGGIATEARSDSQRLQAYQLLYTGIERTPVCGVVRSLPLHGRPCPVMNEFFATMQDVYVWIGELAERPECRDTADQRPLTRRHAAYRLARMVGEDGSTLLAEDIDGIAHAAAETQAEQLARAMDLQRMQLGYTRCQHVVMSGHGGFLVEAALRVLEWNPTRIDFGLLLGASISRCSTARAVACLADACLEEGVEGDAAIVKGRGPHSEGSGMREDRFEEDVG